MNLREKYAAALRRLEAATTATGALTTDSTDEQRSAALAEHEAASTECRSLREQIQREADLAEARKAAPIEPAPDTDPEKRDGGGSPSLSIGREPGTYGPHVPKRSYFLDVARVQVLGDPEARARLKRHMDEQKAELERREKLAERGLDAGLQKMLEGMPDAVAQRIADAMGVEKRALTTTDGAGGDFVPPLYLIDEYVAAARAGRPFINACRNLPLPGGTDSVNIPKILTGTATAVQATQNTAVQNTDLTTGVVTAPVRTIAGQQTVPLQLLEQSPISFDVIVFQDLLDDYNYRCEEQGFIGTGSSGQIKGILQASGLVTVTYTDASPTVPELYPKIADGLQQARTNRKKAITHGWAAPRRSYWITAALDSNNRPLVAPTQQGPNNALGVPTPEAGGGSGEDFVLNMLVPTRMTDAMPINLGGSTNEDRIVLTRNADHVFMEGTLRTRALQETKGDQLSVMLQVYNYVAFTAERYPSGIAVVAGTGLATPTF